MKIDIVCNDGSPLKVTTRSIYGEDGRVGVGGAELGLLTMCEAWDKAGHEVCLYNDPDTKGASPFEQREKDSFEPKEKRDVVITFRSANKRTKDANGLHVWWSTDQFTLGGFKEFAECVDKIVTISDYHALFFEGQYGLKDTIVIDLPVRVDDYKQEIKKVPGRCIFTSVPDRGLEGLAVAWPKIKALHPGASLVITSDYRLWGTDTPRNDKYRIQWLDQENTEFMGAIPRRKLVEEEMKAQILAYPCTYEELFCISVAEAQVAGAYPITSGFAAVETTNMGIVLPGDPVSYDWLWRTFAGEVAKMLNSSHLSTRQNQVRKLAMDRFNPETIVSQWDEKVFV